MNKLPTQKRVQILSPLCEGSSMRSVSRVCDVSINTVAKLLVEADRFGAGFHDAKVRGVKARRVQVDEIWSFTGAKAKNVATMKRPVEGAGDTWTWTALEADTKLIVSTFIGGRDSYYADLFIRDLADADAHAPVYEADQCLLKEVREPCWYNSIRIHKTLRVTPAMAAGISDKLWSWEDMVALMDADQPTQKRGPYKKSQSEISH